MKIELMNEECTVDGVDYVAIDSDNTLKCPNCAGQANDELCLALGECRAWVRDDNKNIQWIEKEAQSPLIKGE